MEEALKMLHVTNARGDHDMSLWKKACFEDVCFEKIRNTGKFLRKAQAIYNLFLFVKFGMSFEQRKVFETSQQAEASVLSLICLMHFCKVAVDSL